MKAYPGAEWEYTPIHANMEPFAEVSTNMPMIKWNDRDLGVNPLYHLNAAAMIDSRTAIAWLGKLPQGLIAASISKGARIGEVFPFELAVPLVAAVAANGKEYKVAEGVALLFQKGDVIQAREGTGDYEEVGTITDIKAATNGTVTLTVSAGTATPLTTAGAITHVNTGPIGVIDSAFVSLAGGANIALLWSNAVLWKHEVRNATPDALKALGALEDGRYIVLK